MSKLIRKSAIWSCNHGVTKRFILSSPIGDLELINCPKGIVSLKMNADKIQEDDFMPDYSVNIKVKESKTEGINQITKKTIEWLNNYFTTPVLLTDLPPVCCLIGVNTQAPFRQRIWNSLATTVKFGDAVSYSELAVLSGSPASASRAVGGAMRTNPVSFIIPCHRVILSNGKLGNYSGGRKNCVKQWLLKHEKANV